MKAIKIIFFLTIALLSVCPCNALTSENDTPLPIPTIDAAASVGYFYVGGRYVGESGTQVMQGAMYVEVLRPRHVVHRYPLVLIHGAAQTGTNWLAWISTTHLSTKRRSPVGRRHTRACPPDTHIFCCGIRAPARTSAASG